MVVNSSRVSLCLEVKESHPVYVYIYIFMQVFFRVLFFLVQDPLEYE